MKKTCIVSFANSDSVRYSKNLARLNQMCAKHCPEIDFLGFTNFSQICSPEHFELNYAFKVFAIRKALELGYTKIIWADSAVYPISNIGSFLQDFDKNGCVFFENIGLPLGYWCNDACIQHYEVTRQESFEMPQVMACLFALDFENAVSIDFWTRFEKDALNQKLCNGAWTNKNLEVSIDALVNGHRHDQSIMSFILNSMNVEMANPMKTHLAYKEWYNRSDLKISETVCFNSNSY